MKLLPYQLRWIEDQSRLKIIEKSRQIGITCADALDSVRKAATKGEAKDVWVSSRDDGTARVYLHHCKRWAQALNLIVQDLGEQLIDQPKDLKAHVLKFSSSRCIYSLSSSPDALVGKTGHIKLDEFAIHKDQRELFRVAKPCTTWGGQLSIISTHRGANTVFNEILRSVTEQGNPMGWSHYRVTLQDAVDQGLVEAINRSTKRNESPEHFVNRIHSECLDQEQWLQEYCCRPSDENSAFLSWEMITAAESPNCLRPFSYLSDRSTISHQPSTTSGSSRSTINDQPSTNNPAFYVGVDVARKQHLCVIDVGEKIGDVMLDRYRVELQNQTFSEIEHELWRILALPPVKRCCIDATGLGMQLAERAKERFGWKVEPITFTPAVKEALAFELRRSFEDKRLRIDADPALRNDLRGIRKEVTVAGHIRFVGEPEPDGHASGHCDRFWAKALRQHAARPFLGIGGGLAI